MDSQGRGGDRITRDQFMCQTQSGAAGAADTHTGAATGSLSDMEVRRRSSSSQMVTIQRRPEARHFRLWK
jgi:hypothetical protein